MSTSTLAALRKPPSPPKWTVDEFHKMCGLGWFVGRRPILLDGVILEQGPMDSPHGNGVERLDNLVRTVFGTGWRIRVQLPLVLEQHTDPMPDIAVIPGTLVGDLSHPATAALVVEVADTTFAIDTTKKAELYATAGILDYWVLDVANRELHVFRDPQPLPAGLGATAYRTHTTLDATASVAPLAAPNGIIRVADMLP